MTIEPYRLHNFAKPPGPVIISVPHAGRDYDSAVSAALRVPLLVARPLEDRYADRLADAAIAAHVPAIIANIPRLVIDLNRAPDDIDPKALRGGVEGGGPTSAKARAGLGLVPTRLWGVGALWHGALDPAVVAERVRAIHAPYHAAIASALETARQSHGTALLLDIHSMPPVLGDDPPDIVIGDRFGRSAAGHITESVEAVFTGLGFRVAVNAPYAGGYIITRHAAPHAAVHALQIEIDRRLYLDGAFDQPTRGIKRVQQAIAATVTMLREAMPEQFAAAAE